MRGQEERGKKLVSRAIEGGVEDRARRPRADKWWKNARVNDKFRTNIRSNFQ